MSLRPIDLQTMFVRLSELSREKAALHDGAVQKAAVDQAESVEESKEREDKVQKAQELPEGPERIREENPQGQKEEQGRHFRKKAGEKTDVESEEPEEPEVVTDPLLGKRIDISG